MEELKTLLAKRKELKEKITSLEATIEEIDSIRQRAPYVEQLSDLEDQLADLEDKITEHVGGLVNNMGPMTLKIEVTVQPSEDDVEFEIDNLENVTDLKDLLKASYTAIIEDNFDSLIYGRMGNIKVE